jgi:hypothetical protein
MKSQFCPVKQNPKFQFVFISGVKSAKFLTAWSRDLSATRFDVSDGIRKRVIYELIFLVVYIGLIIGLFFSPPEFFNSSDTHFVQVFSTEVSTSLQSAFCQHMLPFF